MDRPTCKLCFRRFPNGRALGGHMRSHILSTSAATKHQQVTHQPRRGYGNSPTSSSSSGPHQPSVAVADAGVKIHVPASYGLRENPRKSAKLADPEFSNPDDEELPGYYYGSSYYYHNNHQQQQPLHHSASSAVVQDGESETESSMAAAACVGAVVRRRSKRRRREDSIRVLFPSPGPDTRAAVSNNNKAHDDEQAPVSSVSDATPDEDVALCLVMLSRDTWSVKGEQQNQRHQEVGTGGDGQEEEEEASYDDFDEDDLPIAASGSGSRRGGGGRSRFRCGTCKRTFRSYQALGGHRASHKKAKPWNAHAVDEEDGYQYPNKQSIRGDRIRMKHEEEEEVEEARGDDDDDYSEATGSAAAVPAPDPRIHQCPFCSRVFASGQALGGHKRSHFTYSSSNNYSYLPPPAPRHAGEQSSRGGNANAVGVSPATRNNSNYRRRRDEQLGESFLDLNLPAPLDELDAEVSAVSIAN